jgi:hypothetical protein
VGSSTGGLLGAGAAAHSDELRRQEDLALARPLDRRDKDLGDVGCCEAGVGSMPRFIIVSLTHDGLTALILSPRGISSAAARTKPSRPALTSEIDALPGIGRVASTPVVTVIEPPFRG